MPNTPLNMKLISMSLDFFGVWEVEVTIRGKPYTYALSSEFDVNKFQDEYNRGHYGKALSVLNMFRIKPFLNKEGREM